MSDVSREEIEAKITKLAILVKSYCSWVDNLDSLVNFSPRKLSIELVSLSSEALALPPELDVSDDDYEKLMKQKAKLTSDNQDSIQKKISYLPLDTYCVVFDPLDNKNEKVAMSFSDGLGDIYHDLVHPLDCYDKGQILLAGAAWQNQYYSHWGRHLVHIISALHSLTIEEYDK